MELFDIYKALLSEVGSCRSYRRMNFPLAILCALAVAPFILIFAVLLAVYGLILILNKFLNAPTDYLYSFVKQESQEVKHGTQAVIYFVAFPTIFLLKLLLSLLVFFVFVVHFVTSIIGFFATLGGITFCPFLLDKTDRSVARQSARYATSVVVVFVVLALLLAAMFGTLLIIHDVYTAIPTRGYNDVVSKVLEAKEAGTISDAEYQAFYLAYFSEALNEMTYEQYHTSYFKTESPYSLTDYTNYMSNYYVLSQMLQGILLFLYLLFVMVYIRMFFYAKRANSDAPVSELYVPDAAPESFTPLDPLADESFEE